ncbi:hypothetical protein TNCV_3278431 [Trichonephila clavipes]|nr:hypothetical protein TNCV_3278431 [Trichonephila clavipes]
MAPMMRSTKNLCRGMTSCGLFSRFGSEYIIMTHALLYGGAVPPYTDTITMMSVIDIVHSVSSDNTWNDGMMWQWIRLSIKSCTYNWHFHQQPFNF